MSDWAPPLMFVLLLVFLLSGMPVAFALAGTGLVFGLIGLGLGAYDLRDFADVPSNIFSGIIEKEPLTAVPLFILMGLILEKTGLARDMLTSTESLFRRLRGGLAMAIVLVGAVVAATTGIVGATVVTMTVLSLPTMLASGYDRSLSCGTIAASGTLGQIIPPSIVLILLGDIMNVGIGEMFVGALIPGGILVAAYLGYILIRVALQPRLGPSLQDDGSGIDGKALMKNFAPPMGLMLIVLGSIMSGWATPSEAAGCGAAGAALLALAKRRLRWTNLKESIDQTVLMTAMVFTILAGARFFSAVFQELGGPVWIETLFFGGPVDPWAEEKPTPAGVFGWLTGGSSTGALILILMLVFLLGCFLDFIEICFIVVPILMPILAHLGYADDSDRLWIAVLIAVNLQTSFLTPPFGFSLFYLKGAAPATIETGDIYRGALPYVIIQLLVVGLLFCWDDLILWLPEVVFPGPQLVEASGT